MKRAVFIALFGTALAGCATDPYYPRSPAPIRGEPGTRPPPPPEPTRPNFSAISLPNGEYISPVPGTTPLEDCSVFGIASPDAICVALPATMADGQGSGQAQLAYSERLRTAGFRGSEWSMAYRGSNGCKQDVMLSTLPAKATQSDDWKNVQDYILLMEFTPLAC